MRFQLEKALIRDYSSISSVQHLNTYSILVNTANNIMIKQVELPYLRFSGAYQNTLIRFFAFTEKISGVTEAIDHKSIRKHFNIIF